MQHSKQILILLLNYFESCSLLRFGTTYRGRLVRAKKLVHFLNRMDYTILNKLTSVVYTKVFVRKEKKNERYCA